MRKLFWLSLVGIGLGIALFFQLHPERNVSTPSTIQQPVKPKLDIRYDSHRIQQSIVHTLFIPTDDNFVVIPTLSHQLTTLETIAHKHQAIAAINGGFFDPNNQQSISYIIQQGQLVADPRLNKRLMDNPKLAPYLPKILNRTEFRRYQCGEIFRYDIALHTEAIPAGCQLVDAIGGGPRLLPELTVSQEGFWEVVNGLVIRDPLSSCQPNARSAIGITHDGNILWVMVAQKQGGSHSSGMSLQELADFMKNQGVEKAMNLDGGSSSSFYYKDKTLYGKVDENGNLVQRKVLSVLLVLRK
ncbi:MAG TPA: phosphodiester glycosidase family protein [Cyanophyceae cyanobacterium]